MGTKNQPGDYDCYNNAQPDEPMFILLGRDKHAPLLVEAWADLRELAGEDPVKVAEARQCAESMRAWHWSKEKTRYENLYKEEMRKIDETGRVSPEIQMMIAKGHLKR